MMRVAPLLAAVGMAAVLMTACGGGDEEGFAPELLPPTTAECEYARTLAAQLDDFFSARDALAELLSEPKFDDPGWRNSVTSHLATLKAMREAALALESPPRFSWATGYWKIAWAEWHTEHLGEAMDALDVSKIEGAVTVTRFELAFVGLSASDARRELEAQAASCP